MSAEASASMQLRARIEHRSDSGGFVLDVDTQLPVQGVTAIFGPSGCGKTSLLRAVAGLTRPQPGRIVIGDEIWQDDEQRVWVPTHQRSLGCVFQEASLFDHLTVQGNLDFGLRRIAPQARRVSTEQAVELLGIGHLLKRRPADLSGGERQRVAIARAVLTSPRLLLLDEPLAALDAARKAEVLPWFERMSRELRTPMLYVTHALDEVARLADHLLLLDAGRVLAHGSVAPMLTRLDLAGRYGDGVSALIHGTVQAIDSDYGLLQVRFDGGLIQCLVSAGAPARPAGQPVRLRIQARDVSLSTCAPQATSILNIIPARVTSLQPEGTAQVLVELDAGGTSLLARITRKSADALALAPGQRVYAQIKGVAVLD